MNLFLKQWKAGVEIASLADVPAEWATKLVEASGKGHMPEIEARR
ncbi:MAG: hypothetical protein ACRD0W_25145 [Acidimicrobiales bacterium]